MDKSGNKDYCNVFAHKVLDGMVKIVFNVKVAKFGITIRVVHADKDISSRKGDVRNQTKTDAKIFLIHTGIIGKTYAYAKMVLML